MCQPLAGRRTREIGDVEAGTIGSSGLPSCSSPPALAGKRALVLLFSYYLSDPRPRRSSEALAAAGMDVEVVCLRDARDEPVQETVAGVRIRRIPLRRRRGGKAGYALQYLTFILCAFFLATIRSLRRRYHLVHVHNMPDVLVFAAVVPKLLGAKVILDLHDPMPELMMTIFRLAKTSRAVRHLERLEKWSLALADRVITVNLACKRIFASRSAAEAKIHVTMNCPDEAMFPLAELPENSLVESAAGRAFVLMYHGSLVERHGLDLAVEALRRIREAVPNVELRIYGAHTPFLDQVMEQVRAWRMDDCVRYLGPCRLDELAREIGLCDLGVIPNRRSIFTEINTPTRIFEYLACGKPVIAPSAPGILDYFGPGDLFWFELGNVEDLAARIRFVIDHPAEVQSTVRRGQAIYRAHRWSAERGAFLQMVSGLVGVDHAGVRDTPGERTASNA